MTSAKYRKSCSRGAEFCVGAKYLKLRQMLSELEGYEEFGTDILRSYSTGYYYEIVEYELNRTNGSGDTSHFRYYLG